MRLTSFLALSLGALNALAAKQAKATPDAFADFHAKSLSASPIELNEKSYRALTASPRDYNVAVLLTAMDAKYGCQLCREFQPEWELLARSWTRGDKKGNSRMLFATLDFAKGRDVFMSLGLQTAPVLLFFQPTTGPHAVSKQEPLQYDFASGAQVAEQVHGWMSRHLPDRPHPPVNRPINWLRVVVIGVGALAAITLLWTTSGFLLPFFQNRNLWAAFSLIAILLFTSGHMFNHIRKVPYVASNGRGGVTYFANGFQSQFGMETQVVAALYGILAFCAITLTLKVPRMADPRTQQIAVLICGGLLIFFYSVLLAVFRIKNGGYPYSLPPFM